MSMLCPVPRRSPPPPIIITPAIIEALAAHLAAAGIVSPSADLESIGLHLGARLGQASPLFEGAEHGC